MARRVQGTAGTHRRDASDFLKPIDAQGEHLDFHSLRHTTASWLIAAGADVKTVQNPWVYC